MLQFPDFYRQIYDHTLDSYMSLTPQGKIEKFLQTISSERKRMIHCKNKLKSALYWLDDCLWTEEIEYIDRDDFPSKNKNKIVAGLNKKNQVFHTYHHVYKLLAPYIDEINKREQRECRILEIAGGTGHLALAIEKYALKNQQKIAITCSDIVQCYIDKANAEHRDTQVQYRVIDALQLDKLEPGSFDIAVTLHSLHHFSPEQLGKIFSGSAKLVKHALIAVDAYRSIGNLSFIVGLCLLPSLFERTSMYIHDAWLSGRKMYPDQMLHCLAKLACPNNEVFIKRPSIGLTALVLESNKYWFTRPDSQPEQA